MVASGVLILQFMTYFMVVRGEFQCTNGKSFAVSNKAEEDKEYLEHCKKNGQTTYHEYLVSSGSISQDLLKAKKHIRLKKEFLHKRGVVVHNLQQVQNKMRAERNVRIMKQLCDVKDNDVVFTRECKSPFIAIYFGCVEDEKAVYVFQKDIYMNLKSRDFSDYYSTPDVLIRVSVMLDILEKFIELHKVGYVHNNIEPGNIIFNPNDFSNFKITGLENAGIQGKDLIQSMNNYAPPERYLQFDNLSVLNFNEDVFSLATTLAEVEGMLSFELTQYTGRCYSSSSDKMAQCEKDLFDVIDHIFSDNGLSALAPVFKTALSFDPNKRYKTLMEFAFAIVELFVRLEGGQEFIIKLLMMLQEKGQQTKVQSFWLCKAMSIELASIPFFGAFSEKINIKDSPVTCNDKYEMTFSPKKTTKIVV